ncbi:hypothetical protein ACOME3_010171 [Neoechinorhynchus agilis]
MSAKTRAFVVRISGLRNDRLCESANPRRMRLVYRLTLIQPPHSFLSPQSFYIASLRIVFCLFCVAMSNNQPQETTNVISKSIHLHTIAFEITRLVMMVVTKPRPNQWRGGEVVVS